MGSIISDALREKIKEQVEELESSSGDEHNPDPSHECQVCDTGKEMSTPKHREKSWCDDCGSVQTFKKL